MNNALAEIRALSAATDPTEFDAVISSLTPPAPASLLEAIDHRTPATVDFHGGLRAIIGGPRTGLYEVSEHTRKDDNGRLVTSESEELVVPWVAVRNIEHQEVMIHGNYFKQTGAPTYDVVLVTAKGIYTVEGMSAADSVNPQKVLDLANAGVPEPDFHDAIHVKNMLRILGADEQRKEITTTVGGWVQDSGRAVFIEPLASITSTGLVDSYKLEVDGGDYYSGATGLGVEGADETLNAWFDLTPGRPDVAMAAIAAAGASALGLTNRTTLFLTAEPGSGKTNLMRALMHFSSAPERGGEASVDVNSEETASPAAIHTRCAIVGGMLFFDDIRFAEKSAYRRFSMVAQAGYSPLRRSKLSNEGRERKQVYGESKSLNLISAESSPEGPDMEAIVGRTVTVKLFMGDLDLSDGGAFDRWMAEFNVRANHLRGAYIQWLARRAEVLGGVAALRKETDAARTQFMHSMKQGRDERGKRHAETVSVLRTGWHYLTEFLKDNGVEIPFDEDFTEAAFEQLLVGTREAGANANPVAQLLDWMRDQVGTSGWLSHVGGAMPQNDSKHLSRYGWMNEDGRWHKVGQTAFGYVDEEQGLVLFTNGAITASKTKFDGNRTLPLVKQQLTAGFEKLDYVLDHGVKTSAKYPFGRAGGVIVPLSWFLGGDDSEDEA